MILFIKEIDYRILPGNKDQVIGNSKDTHKNVFSIKNIFKHVSKYPWNDEHYQKQLPILNFEKKIHMKVF